jgi:hypothetical protein
MKWPEDTLLARKSLLNWARGYKHQIPKRSQDLFQALRRRRGRLSASRPDWLLRARLCSDDSTATTTPDSICSISDVTGAHL